MLTEFWKGAAGELGKRWTAITLYPAFAFWAGGLLLRSTSGHHAMSDLSYAGHALSMLPDLGQAAVLVGLLIGVMTSGVLVQSLTFTVLRALEGYWPLWLGWLRYRIIDWRERWRDRIWPGVGPRLRYQELAARRDNGGDLSSAEEDEFVRLEQFWLTVPRYPLPTRLGEVLRSAEEMPRVKYGLDPIICWPHLWLVLKPEQRGELEAARSTLDMMVAIWTWGILFIGWTFWSPWAAPIGVAVAWWAHRQIRESAANYGDLLVAAFDLNRFALYEALRWPMPTDTEQEHESGLRLTAFLRSGSQVRLPLTGGPRPGRLERLLDRLPLASRQPR